MKLEWGSRFYERVMTIFGGRARPIGESKHAAGRHQSPDYRAQLKKKRKAEREHRKLVRRMKAGRKHRR